MPTKRALLIGIDKYAHVPPLDGCANDVALMHSVLTASFGFSQDNITTVLNDGATRDGILAALDTLIDATGSDDLVLIHYAGHGSQMTDREGDEPSGLDSTIVPVDSGRAPQENRDITDDEIHLKLEALGKKTAFTTLVFDACHSGTITRDAFGAKARSVEPDRRPIAELPPSPIPEGRVARTRSTSSGWMPLADKYVLIAGCRDEERSYEYRPPEADGAVAHGALTYFLCQQLRQADPGTSYRDIFERAATRVTAENGEQHPQMEGQADREVFGVTDLTPMTFLRVVGRQGETITLAGGAAHGLTVGSTYAVFAPGTKDATGSPMASVVVRTVHATTSSAQVTQEATPGLAGVDCRAFETTHAFGTFRMPVQVMPAQDSDDGGHVTTLSAALGQSRRLTVVTDAAVARAYLLPARATVSAGSPVPQAGPLGQARWAVVSQTGDLLMPLKPLGDDQTVVENLETVSRYRQVLMTDNPAPQSRLKGRFQLDLLRRASDGTWAVAEPESDGGHVVYDEGEAIAFRLTSRHEAPTHVALLDIGLSGAVSIIRQEERLGAGVTYDIGASGELQLTFPQIYPFVDSADHLREAEGLETLKLFVTQQPTDFTAVTQSGVRSLESPTSPLTSLLRGVLHGSATREITVAPVGGEDWTTLTRSFVLRRRRSGTLTEATPVSVGHATLSASGLSGTVTVDYGKAARQQSAELVSGALQRAFDASGFTTNRTFELSNATATATATRGDIRPAGLTLTLAEPPDGFGQMVLAADQSGIVSWCLPTLPAGGTRSLGNDPATRTYVIPGGAADTSEPTSGTRGLIAVAGKKILKELLFPLIDPVLGEIGATFTNRVEHAVTPYRLRPFTPDDYGGYEARSLDNTDWPRLARGRALLLVHGTASRTDMAFHQLPKDYVETLTRLYEGRVFAFDHFTLSHDPTENIRQFVALLPESVDLTLDIVSHSRGGLVSRVLSEKQGELSLGSRRMRVGKVVFVGVPSAGTALAVPDHWTDAFSVLTNLMDVLPDNGITDGVTLILSALKQIVVGGLSHLDGLQSMEPGGAYASWLNTGDRTGDTRYFAVASDVSPVDPGFRRLIVRYGLNQLFHGGNDLVVPAAGVYAANGSGYFPIDDRLVLEGREAMSHTQYFADTRVRHQLLEWLSA